MNGGIKEYLTRTDWNPDVKAALNGYIADTGKDSENYDKTSYAVFDFDNTTSVFDCEEMLVVYLIENMCFGMTPSEMERALYADLQHPENVKQWISDIVSAYSRLYEKYGPFSYRGVDKETAVSIQKDSDWKELASKLQAVYPRVYENETSVVAYPWLTYWFSGMTKDELYDLSKRSHSRYENEKTECVKWESPKGYKSLVGNASHTHTVGVSVTENLKELMRALDENGISVWICSASYREVITAAVDAFGLHDCVTGVIGMTNKTVNGRLYPSYDFETGYAMLSGPDGVWEEDNLPTRAQTQKGGKVISLVNTLCKKYGHGPSAGFMDSLGDFNFCTEFETLRTVVCFNCLRPATDGGGLIAALSVYQRECLGYDYKKAGEKGDTLYLLQGRDENGTRSLRPSEKTLLIGETEEKRFGDGGDELLEKMKAEKLTTAEIINRFAAEKRASGGELSRESGYRGYHTVK